MSRTNLHSEKGKWKNTGIKLSDNLRRFFNRYNFDVSEFKEKRIYIREQIMKKELKSELYEKH